MGPGMQTCAYDPSGACGQTAWLTQMSTSSHSSRSLNLGGGLSLVSGLLSSLKFYFSFL